MFCLGRRSQTSSYSKDEFCIGGGFDSEPSHTPLLLAAMNTDWEPK